MAAVTICSDFGAPKDKKSDTVSTVSPSICHEVMGPDAMIFIFTFTQNFIFNKTLYCVFAVVYVSSSYGQQLGVMQHQDHDMLFYIIPNALLMQIIAVAEL